jgi:hypothetical protein
MSLRLARARGRSSSSVLVIASEAKADTIDGRFTADRAHPLFAFVGRRKG